MTISHVTIVTYHVIYVVGITSRKAGMGTRNMGSFLFSHVET